MSLALQDHNLLIVSDLHLSEGRDPRTRKLSLNEDFFVDEEFARFLAYYADEARWPQRKWHLIINGDFLDFLQVTAIEGAAPDLSRDPKRPYYGLGCGAKETVYKLKVIMNGHWQFFEALAEFLSAGNILSISPGNHDVEFHYEEVRIAFREELRSLYTNRLNREGIAGAPEKLGRLTEDSIRFIEWFYYEPGFLWVEHGNQYDRLNNFKYWLSPLLPDLPSVDVRRKDEVDLPWGSVFVRYLFNRVETALPFADNIKPQNKFITWFISFQPLQAVHFVLRDGTYMLRKMARAFQPVPPEAYARRASEHSKRLKRIATESGIEETDLQHIDGLREHNVFREPRGRWCFIAWMTRSWRILIPVIAVILLLPQLAVLLPVLDWLQGYPAIQQWMTAAAPIVRRGVSLIRWLGLAGLILAWLIPRLGSLLRVRLARKKELSYLAKSASRICKRLHVKYVIMGHTHETDLQSIGDSGEEYFNTGTWTKVFRPDEERLVSEESELVFVQAIREGAGLKMKLLKWVDQAGEPRLVKLFQD